METTLSNNPADLDKLIQSFEYENQQYVKLIEKERQQIEVLEREIDEKKKSVEQFQESVSHLDENTKRAHKQFTLNRDNCESLKKTIAVLKDHEEALKRKLSSIIEDGRKESMERDGILKHYKDIFADYEVKYKSFPLAKTLEEKNNEVMNLRKMTKEAESNITQLRANIKQLEEDNDEEFSDWTKFVVKIAQMKLDTENVKNEICLLSNEKKEIDLQIEEAKQKALQIEQEAKLAEEKERREQREINIDKLQEDVTTTDTSLKNTADTILSDNEFTVDQANDDEESAMISMYTGKEDEESVSTPFIEAKRVQQSIADLSTFNQGHMTDHNEINKMTSHSTPQITNTQTGHSKDNMTTCSVSDVILDSGDSLRGVLGNNTSSLNGVTASISPQEHLQVTQPSRSVPPQISHRSPAPLQVYFKAPTVPVMSSVKLSARSAVPSITSPRVNRLETSFGPPKRQLVVPSSPQRPLTSTTTKSQQSIMSPKPFVPTLAHSPALSPQIKPQSLSMIKPVISTIGSSSKVVPKMAPKTHPFTLSQSPLLTQIPPKSPQVPQRSPQVPPLVNRHLPSVSPKIPFSNYSVQSSNTSSQVHPAIHPVHSQSAQQASRSSQEAQMLTKQSPRVLPISPKTTKCGTPQLSQLAKQAMSKSPRTPSPKASSPMEVSPECHSASKSSPSQETPEHQKNKSGDNLQGELSPFSSDMEKYQQKIQEMRNKSPGVHLKYDKRPMFNAANMTNTIETQNKEEIGSFMTSFIRPSTDEKNESFMMGCSDTSKTSDTEMSIFSGSNTDNSQIGGSETSLFGGSGGDTFIMGGTEMSMFGGSGSGTFKMGGTETSMFGGSGGDTEMTLFRGSSGGNLFGNSGGSNFFTSGITSPEKNGPSEMNFNFGGSRNTGSSDNSGNEATLMSLFGGGESSPENTTQETSFSFSFGGGNQEKSESQGFSLF